MREKILFFQVVWNVSDGTAICGTPAHSEIAHTVKFFNNRWDRLVTAGTHINI